MGRDYVLLTKPKRRVLILRANITAMIFLYASLAAAQDPIQLWVQPQRCVSLHQGQTCYQKLKLKWQTPATGEYCLYFAPNSKPLLCWQGTTRTEYEDEFQSSESAAYEIRHKGADEVLASVKVQVASVYKSPKRSTSGWRLF